MKITSHPEQITIDGESFRVVVSVARPRAALHVGETRWSNLWLLPGAERIGMQDTALRISPPEIIEDPDGVTVRVSATSTAWARRTGVLRITDRTVEQHLEIEGTGELGEVSLLGGKAVLPTGASGTFRSAIGFDTVFSPAPSEPILGIRPAHHAVSLSSYGDADSGRMNAVFSPSPLVLGWARGVAPHPTALPDGDWLACSLRCGSEEAGFTQFRYEPLDGGFQLVLDYEGHTSVEGTWHSPTVVLVRAGSPEGCIGVHRDDLIEHGMAPEVPERIIPAWHLQPIFCGWGAQCARAAQHNRGLAETDLVGGSTALAAPAFATQENYDQWLSLLAEAGLNPGTIVLDDRWQASYGLNTPDTDKWPDLKGWIAKQHDAGRKVLLWWKAWDPEDIPAEECIRLPDGTPLSVDPDHPGYQERLRRTIAGLLGPDGLDADGFKLDFTQRGPSGQGLLHSGRSWGYAAHFRLVSQIHAAGHAAKSDALVVTQTMHPWFARSSDMARLNDVFEWGVDGARVEAAEQLEFRARIARAALPGLPLDTDQWPMGNREQWLAYLREQPRWGVPALYYLESIDNSGERIHAEDLAVVRRTWQDYRERLGR